MSRGRAEVAGDDAVLRTQVNNTHDSSADILQPRGVAATPGKLVPPPARHLRADNARGNGD